MSLSSGSTRAVADLAVNGAPNAMVQVPAGYVAEDVSGKLLLDANGSPGRIQPVDATPPLLTQILGVASTG